MGLLGFLDKKTDVRTPILIKVVAVVHAFFIVSTLSRLMFRGGLPGLPAVAGIGIQVLVLIAFWNMRRWSVIAFLVFAVYGLIQLSMIYDGNIPANVLLATAVVRGFVIVPGLVYWNSMSW
jgi:hypothetical protein